MKALLVTRLCAISLVLAGCTGDQGQDLFETAQFEERQNNQAHARELYELIVKQYPNGEVAKKATERLARLKQGETLKSSGGETP